MSAKDKVNILMVDDQPAKLLTYETILSELGENLIRANSAREALEHLLQTEVAVLLIDVQMPDLDGFELATIIRQHPRFESTAIIFISGVQFADYDRLKGYRIGAVDYVSVPVVPEILCSKVRVFADLYRNTRALEKLNMQLELHVAERTSALAASEERFRLATEAMRGGLYDWNLRTNVSWISAGLAELLGSSTEGVTPSSEWWQTRIHPDDLTGPWVERQADVALSASAVDIQYRIQHYDGHWLWVWDRGRIVRAEDGKAIRVVGHVTDISRQKSAEIALRDADEKKDQFLATLSHELRNPLAPIRHAVGIMRQPAISSSEIEEGLGVIDRQVAHLSRLVDDLLDWNRMSRNKIVLRKTRVNLAEAISAAVEASQAWLDQNKLHLAIQLPEEPVVVDGDFIRLTQVLTNLLNNSAKFTPMGGRVGIAVESEAGYAVMRVKDTGIGIAPEELERLFQMFYQGSNASSGDGLGIGLALSSRVVELHGGEIKANSAGLGAGSEFVIRLPASQTAPVAGEDPWTPNGQTGIRRVLVVDDNEDGATSLAKLLKLEGFEVRTAYDGVTALTVASHFLPDVILLDIRMPGMDGYTVARSIREQPWGKHIALIAQTGYGAESDVANAVRAGFDAHVTKPFAYEVLAKAFNDCAAIRKTSVTR